MYSIGELLKTNNTLTYLSLRNNNITDVQSIGEGLKTNNTLELFLDNNNITDVQSIGEGLKTNNTLWGLDLLIIILLMIVEYKVLLMDKTNNTLKTLTYIIINLVIK